MALVLSVIECSYSVIKDNIGISRRVARWANFVEDAIFEKNRLFYPLSFTACVVIEFTFAQQTFGGQMRSFWQVVRFEIQAQFEDLKPGYSKTVFYALYLVRLTHKCRTVTYGIPPQVFESHFES